MMRSSLSRRWERRESGPAKERRTKAQTKAQTERAELVAQAKRRLASGFYDLPECLDVAVGAMLKVLPRKAAPRRPDRAPRKKDGAESLKTRRPRRIAWQPR